MSDRDGLANLMNAFQRLIRDADATEQVHAGPRAWLDKLGLPDEHLNAFSAVDEKRLLLYRKLVRGGLRSAIAQQLSLTAARLGPLFDDWVERFCTEEMPRSHYLRDVAFEFVAWALPKWTQDPVIANYIPDLARYELLAFEISTAVDDERKAHGSNLMLDQAVIFDASVRMQRYAFAVHRLSDDEANRDLPDREPTSILGYRDRAFDLHYLELTPLAADVVERLLSGELFGAAVLSAYGGPPPPDVLQGVANVLADLAERGALLGSAGPKR